MAAMPGVSSGWIHVGLGRATGAEVRVRWPDGEVGQWRPIDVDAFSIVDRAAGEVSRLVPAAELTRRLSSAAARRR